MVTLLRIFFLFTLLSGTVLAQGYGDIIWKKNLGGAGFEEPTDVLTSGGWTYVLGFSNSNSGDFSVNNGSSDLWLYKLDRAGNKSWAYNFGGSGFDLGQKLLLMPDGGIAVVGLTTSTNLPGFRSAVDGLYIRLSPQGNVLLDTLINGVGFAEQFVAASREDLFGADTIGNTGVVVVGQTNGTFLYGPQDPSDTLSGSVDALIMKLTNAAQYQWHNRVFRNDTLKNLPQVASQGGISAILNRFKGVVHLNRGGYVAVGDAAFFGDSNVGDAYLVRFNEAGDTVWTRLLGGAQGDDGLRIEETSDGNVIVLMERRKPKAGNFPEPDLWLAKINTTSGSTMWQRILGTGFVESPQDMVLVADTIVAVVGWQDVDEAGVATGYDGFLDRYDARTGATIGSRRLFGASGKEDRAYSVSYDNQTDDYIIACGSIGTSTFFPETKGETDWWIIRMAGDNSAFQQWVSRADGQPGVAQGEELRAWPNPARGSLSLNRTDLDYVELYNLAGMRVQRWEGAGHRQLDLSGLGAGMYLLKAAKGSQSWNQKIVIQ
ncbi:MAG: T9SS type A sorting domain-containing protein [Bacteroidetes bacterium]|jgi:hypothetical protein|nr:T9SS type A sorting domain-containing protein [Bacteroidota bacterium]